jgi:hypothetical protein
VELEKTIDVSVPKVAEIDKVKQSIQPFLAAAQSGGFGISEEAGWALITAIRHCQDGLLTAKAELGRIQEATKLGNSPDAQAMTKFNLDVATGETNSAMATLDGLKTVLDQMERGVADAMREYRGTDETNASQIGRAGTEIAEG